MSYTIPAQDAPEGQAAKETPGTVILGITGGALGALSPAAEPMARKAEELAPHLKQALTTKPPAPEPVPEDTLDNKPSAPGSVPTPGRRM